METLITRPLEDNLRGRLRRLKPGLPYDTRPPVISQYSPSEQPAPVLGSTGSQDLPSGVLNQGAYRVPLKVAGQVRAPEEVAALPIVEHPGG